MPDTENQKNVVHRYIAAFNAGATDEIAALFNEKATVEDPIGTPAHVGREAIARFYRRAVKTGAKLDLQGSIRVTGPYAAFPFSARLMVGGSEQQVDVIDTFRFDEEGRIFEMRAYFEASDVTSFA